MTEQLDAQTDPAVLVDLPAPDLDAAPLPADPAELAAADLDDQEARDYSAAEVENIRRHLDELMSTAATAGAQFFPPELQEAYQRDFLRNNLIRNGLRLSGAPEVLNELMPPAGKGEDGSIERGAPAAVQRLPSWVRLGLGVVVLGVGMWHQGRTFAAKHSGPQQ